MYSLLYSKRFFPDQETRSCVGGGNLEEGEEESQTPDQEG